MAVLRGRGVGLEIALGKDFEQTLAELRGKLGERPGFYTGTQASAAASDSNLSEDQLQRLRSLLQEHGITLGSVNYQPPDGEEFARRRAARPKRDVQLSDNARSLVADFAGARADIAERRARGHATVRRPAPAHTLLSKTPVTIAPAAAPAPTPTLFHTGTLRGGQSLHHPGNVVVVGDVNPGAEIVATGDIVVFGALRGVAHAGARGDATARVHAIELAVTQLRIATYIAADASTDAGKRGPETACVQNERIAIFARENAPQ